MSATALFAHAFTACRQPARTRLMRNAAGLNFSVTLEGKAKDSCLLRRAPDVARCFGAFSGEAKALNAREIAHNPAGDADVAA